MIGVVAPLPPAPTWFLAVESFGVLSLGLNTMIVARAQNFSALGVMMVTAAAAMSGSALRDLMLGPDAQPFVWVKAPWLLLITLAVSLLYSTLPSVQRLLRKKHPVTLHLAESAAVASLAMAGVGKCLRLLADDVPIGLRGELALPFLATIIALIGAVGGTVVRDVLLGRVPSALKREARMLEPLVCGCLLAAALIVFLDVARAEAFAAGFFTVFGVRFLLVRRAERRLATKER